MTAYLPLPPRQALLPTFRISLDSEYPLRRKRHYSPELFVFFLWQAVTSHCLRSEHRRRKGYKRAVMILWQGQFVMRAIFSQKQSVERKIRSRAEERLRDEKTDSSRKCFALADIDNVALNEVSIKGLNDCQKRITEDKVGHYSVEAQMISTHRISPTQTTGFDFSNSTLYP